MDAAGLLRCYKHLIDRWHDAEGGRLRAAVSCSAPQRVTPEYFRALDDLSRMHNLPFYIHVLETKVQRMFGEERLGGRSLVRYIQDHGLLSARLNIIHGIWLDGEDLDLIAAAGCLVAHNPISNLRLGSGIMPFRSMRSRGIPLCLGTDEAITDDAVNLWNVMKFTGLIHNITHPDYETWPTAREVLQCAITGGAQAMRSPRPVGQVSPDFQADLVLIDLDTLPFTPLNDLRRQLVYCESGGSVRMTLVQGRIVFEDGHLTLVDEAAIRAEARDLATQFNAPARGPGGHDAAEWAPYYREMYLRAAAQDAGMTRCACQIRVGRGPEETVVTAPPRKPGSPLRTQNAVPVPSHRRPSALSSGRTARAWQCISRWASSNIPWAKDLSENLVPGALHPDVLNSSWRDYGNRVGAWRLLEAFREYQLPLSILLNSAVCESAPDLVKAAVAQGCELIAHGYSNSDTLQGLSEPQEAEYLRRVAAANSAVLRPRTRGLVESMDRRDGTYAGPAQGIRLRAMSWTSAWMISRYGSARGRAACCPCRTHRRSTTVRRSSVGRRAPRSSAG